MEYAWIIAGLAGFLVYWMVDEVLENFYPFSNMEEED